MNSRFTCALGFAVGLVLALGLIHHGQRLENPSARLILTPEWLQEARGTNALGQW